jgi:hypothetical protein
LKVQNDHIAYAILSEIRVGESDPFLQKAFSMITYYVLKIFQNANSEIVTALDFADKDVFYDTIFRLYVKENG